MSDAFDDHDLEPAERDLGLRLSRQRPVPSADFRGALGRHLAARDPGYGPRPPQLRVISAMYTGGGLAVMAIGALVATGAL